MEDYLKQYRTPLILVVILSFAIGLIWSRNSSLDSQITPPTLIKTPSPARPAVPTNFYQTPTGQIVPSTAPDSPTRLPQSGPGKNLTKENKVSTQLFLFTLNCDPEKAESIKQIDQQVAGLAEKLNKCNTGENREEFLENITQCQTLSPEEKKTVTDWAQLITANCLAP